MKTLRKIGDFFASLFRRKKKSYSAFNDSTVNMIKDINKDMKDLEKKIKKK